MHAHRLQNAPELIKRAISVVLLTVKYQFVHDYLESIKGFSIRPEEHIYHVKHVFTLPCNAGATLEFKNGNFSPMPSTFSGASHNRKG